MWVELTAGGFDYNDNNWIRGCLPYFHLNASGRLFLLPRVERANPAVFEMAWTSLHELHSVSEKSSFFPSVLQEWESSELTAVRSVPDSREALIKCWNIHVLLGCEYGGSKVSLLEFLFQTKSNMHSFCKYLFNLYAGMFYAYRKFFDFAVYT